MQKQFRQTLFVLFSQGFPMLLGIAIIPILIKDMGQERFGFLTVVWSLLGYFGFLDLGISRTITKMVAEEGVVSIEQQNFNFVPVSHRLVQWVSVFGSLIGGAIVLANFHHFFKIDESMSMELKWSATVIILAVPFVVLTSYYRGLLDGQFKFSESNRIQIVGGILLFLGPWVFWQINPRMESVMIGILISRLGLFLFAFGLTRKIRALSSMNTKIVFWTEAKRLLTHGGWITVGNVLAPIMSSLDRLLLTQLVPLAQVTFYSAPMELISRLWVVPGGVSRVYFPKFAATKTEVELISSFKSAYLIMAIFMVPITTIGFLFMRPLLTVWINADFSNESTLVAQIILLGVFVNSFNWITYGYLQSSSKVAWSIYTVILEVPLFLGFFYWGTTNFGIIGAASVWAGRLILDFVLTHFVVAYFKKSLLPFFLLIHVGLAIVLFVAFLAV